MLRVSVHSGMRETRTHGNQLAVLDIAYQKQEALADYLVALSTVQVGEFESGMVTSYPRWAASLWDLVARALTRALYQADQAPLAQKPDRRCAYATRLCAVIEKQSTTGHGIELGHAEIIQDGTRRGRYVAAFDEDILGPRTVKFEYGHKRLNPADLLLRAICQALYGADILGPRPKLILPPTMSVDGVDRFHIEALTEPARTGFERYVAALHPTNKPEPLPKAQDYVSFLMKG